MNTDDLPWPELGNVSRGATRGNQGSKGVLGPPDASGRAILQLRVQPNVLAVKLNPTATIWYRMLDTEVQRALKETKTYWRKARRRQDYDVLADTDHMELHEWLQQLKDKCMSHIELLLQKGDITGPPYIMPDHIEFTFMRGFIERQRTGVPHNPRLRGLPHSEMHRIPPEELEGDDADARGSPESVSSPSKSPVSTLPIARPAPSSSPTWSNVHQEALSSSQQVDIARRMENAQNALRQSRSRLRLARTTAQDAYVRYRQSTDQVQIFEAEVTRAEERLDELVNSLLRQAASTPGSSTSKMPAQGSSTELQVQTHQAQVQAQGQNQSQSTTTTPIATSAPNGVYDLVGMRALVPTSHAQPPHPQHQHQHPQMTSYTQAHVYPWTTTPTSYSSTPGGPGPPQRPASSISVSSAPGGLNIDLANDPRYGPDMSMSASGAGAGRAGPSTNEEWTGAAEGEAAMIHAHTVSRVASPQRKHPRDWEASAQQQAPHMAIRDSGDDTTSRPPRKRVTQVDASSGPGLALALPLGTGSPHTPLPSPHPQQQQQSHQHQQQQHQQQQHAYHGWTTFTSATGHDSRQT